MKEKITSAFVLIITFLCIYFIGAAPAENADAEYILKNNEKIEFIKPDDSRYVNYNGFANNETAGVYSGAAGRKYSVTFVGTGIEFYCQVGRDKGIYIIETDGAETGRADGYSETSEEKLLVSVTDLDFAEHTVSLTISNEVNPANTSGGKYLQIRKVKLIRRISADDVISVDETLPAGTVAADKGATPANIEYNGFTENGNKLVSTGEGSLTYRFRGNALLLYAKKGAECGSFKVFLDGQFKGIVKLFSNEEDENALAYGTGDIKYGVHKLSLETFDASYLYECGSEVSVFSFVVYRKEGIDEENLSPDYDDIVPDNDFVLPLTEEFAEIALNDGKTVNREGFEYSASSGLFSGSAGARVTFTFEGTGIEFTGAFAKDKGSASVYVDGEFMGNLNFYSVSSGKRLGGIIHGLENALHSVTVTILEKTNPDATGNYVQLTKVRYISIVDSSDLKLAERDTEGYAESVKYFDDANVILNDFSVENGVAHSSTTGDGITYRFRGVALRLYADTGTSFGKIDLTIDGNYVGRINTYRAENAADCEVYVTEILDETVHTVTFTVTDKSVLSSGNEVRLTKMKIYASAGVDVDNVIIDAYDIKIDEEYSVPDGYEYSLVDLAGRSVALEGFERIGSQISASGGGKSFTAVFRGEGVEITGHRGQYGGRFFVEIDGIYIGSVTTYSGDEKDGAIFRVGDLQSGYHKITVTTLAESSESSLGNNVSVYAVKSIRRTDSAGDLTVIDDASYEVFNYYMTHGEGADYYGNTILYGNRNGAYLYLRFRGSDIAAFGSEGKNQGEGNIYLDGEFYGTFSTYSETDASQRPWFFINGLDASENHSVVVIIENDERKYLSFDYFEIGDYSAPIYTNEGSMPDTEPDDPVVSVEFKEPDKLVYYTDYPEYENLSGGYIKETYQSGREWTFSLRDAIVDFSAVDNHTAGRYQINVVFGQEEFSFFIELLEDSVTEVSIEREIDKKEYFTGEYLDLSGGIVSVVYKSGRRDLYGMGDNGVLVTGYDSSTVTDSLKLTVNVYGADKTAEFTVRIMPSGSGENKKGCKGEISSAGGLLLFAAAAVFRKKRAHK